MRRARALAVAPEADDLPPAPIGDNNPPADPFEAIRVHLDDLVTEARNWADGTAITTDAQADEISRLIDGLRKGEKVADDLRKQTKQPHMDAAKAVDERFKPMLTAADRAIAATKKTIAAWLELKERQKREAEEAARAAAQAAARKAAMDRALVDETNLESQERAAEATTAAEDLAKAARKIERETVAARGGSRAMTLRTYYTARLTNRRDALFHYVSAQPEAFEEFLLKLAQADVNRGVRTIPGVAVDEDRRPV